MNNKKMSLIKRKFKISYFIFPSLIILGFGCMDHVDRRNIRITNNTPTSIYCLLSENDKFPEMVLSYPDSIMKYFCLKPGQTNGLSDPPINSWDVYINNSDNQNCRLLVFSEDTIKKYGWKVVKEHSVYVKKYLINIDYLDKIKWEILYTGK